MSGLDGVDGIAPSNLGLDAALESTCLTNAYGESEALSPAGRKLKAHLRCYLLHLTQLV